MSDFFIRFYLMCSVFAVLLAGCSNSTTKAYYTGESRGRFIYYTVEIPCFNFRDSCVSYEVSYRLDSFFNIQEISSFYNGLHCQRGDTIFYKGMTLLASAELNDCWVFKKPYYPSDEYKACLNHVAQDTLINQVLCRKCFIYYIENLSGTVDDYPVSFYYDPDRRLMVAMSVKNEHGKIIMEESIKYIE